MSSAFFLLPSACLAAALLYAAFSRKNEQGDARYLHPDRRPVIGNLLNLAQRRSKLLRWLAEQNLRFDGKPYILVSPLVAKIVIDHEPADLEYVFKNIDVFGKGKPFSEKLEEAFGKGMIGVDGEPWKVQRKAGLHMFTQRMLKSFVEEFMPAQIIRVKKFLREQGGQVVDLQEVLSDLTGRIWLHAAFGEEMANDSSFGSLFDTLMEATDSRFRNPFWQATEWAFGSDFSKAAKELRPKVQELVAKSQSDFVKNLKDNLDNEDDIVDAALTYLFGGRDTLAVAMSWMFEAMMQQPELFHHVRQEASGKPITFEALKDFEKTLPYANGVVSETFRLYPSLPLNVRECQQDTVLPSGIPLTANGHWVLWSPWVTGRSKELWGADAEEFRPERWLEQGMQHRSAYQHPVFHGGPRSCLGQHLAKLLVSYALIDLTREFDFVKVGEPAETTNSIVLRIEGGLHCRVQLPI